MAGPHSILHPMVQVRLCPLYRPRPHLPLGTALPRRSRRPRQRRASGQLAMGAFSPPLPSPLPLSVSPCSPNIYDRHKTTSGPSSCSPRPQTSPSPVDPPRRRRRRPRGRRSSSCRSRRTATSLRLSRGAAGSRGARPSRPSSPKLKPTPNPKFPRTTSHPKSRKAQNFPKTRKAKAQT